MKEIKLSRGLVALVDDEDYEYLNQWRWYAHRGHSKRSKTEKYYAGRRFVMSKYNYKFIFMHNVIMPHMSGEVDHIDRNSLNNQKANLRICSHKENIKNTNMSEFSKQKQLEIDRLARIARTKQLIAFAKTIKHD